MTVQNQTGGAGDPTGGAVSGESEIIKEDKAFLKLKEEKRIIAEKYNETQSRLEKLEREAKEKQDEALKQQGEYKKLWEDGEKARASLEEELNLKKKRELALRKIDVVMKEFGVPLAKPEYWDFVGLDRISLDETTGDVDMNIVKQVANDFVLKYPELLSKKPGKAPNEAPGTSKPLSHEDWKKLPLSEKRLRMKDIKK